MVLDKYEQINYYKYRKYKNKYNNLLKQSRIINNSHYQNIQKILSIAPTVQIIGMGEASHGQEEITKVRIKIFKELVKKCGYSVFILEDQYSCCEEINKYLQTGIGNPKKLLLHLAWFWWSYDMLKLVKWMRKYNKNNGNILEFHGIDIQSVCDGYHNTNDGIAKYVEKKFLENGSVDQDDWVVADGFRDRSMYGVFMKIYNPKKKYFIYAHNYHISRNDIVGSNNYKAGTQWEGRDFNGDEKVKWLGCYLSKKFGNNYFSIGNIFTRGGYLETEDIVGQRADGGESTNYDKIGGTNFVIVKNPPIIGKMDINIFPEGLTIFDKPEDFDAVMVIRKEYPIKLIKYY